jgi:hypothetical protein
MLKLTEAQLRPPFPNDGDRSSVSGVHLLISEAATIVTVGDTGDDGVEVLMFSGDDEFHEAQPDGV